MSTTISLNQSLVGLQSAPCSKICFGWWNRLNLFKLRSLYFSERFISCRKAPSCVWTIGCGTQVIVTGTNNANREESWRTLCRFRLLDFSTISWCCFLMLSPHYLRALEFTNQSPTSHLTLFAHRGSFFLSPAKRCCGCALWWSHCQPMSSWLAVYVPWAPSLNHFLRAVSEKPFSPQWNILASYTCVHSNTHTHMWVAI